VFAVTLEQFSADVVDVAFCDTVNAACLISFRVKNRLKSALICSDLKEIKYFFS
jgi:hypothetical protein